jgi:glycosyltransferase involved in cell wall biosynthesis
LTNTLPEDLCVGILMLPIKPPDIKDCGGVRDLEKLPANVKVINRLPRRAVMQAWKRSLFGTVPSLCRDASPTVTLEAMACGKPVIGSRIGGISDQIVDGETGFLIPPGDVNALRDAMNRLIKDPALRSRMGAAAQAKVKDFQSTRVIDRIEAVYEQLLCRSHSYEAGVDREIGVAGAS